jgi:hypothetical protein
VKKLRVGVFVVVVVVVVQVGRALVLGEGQKQFEVLSTITHENKQNLSTLGASTGASSPPPKEMLVFPPGGA